MKNAGWNMMKALGDGILSGVEFPFKAAWHIAEKIGRLTIGKSPPPEGPLHYLDRPRLMETLAGSLHPAPVVRAATRVAAAVAVAAPMTTGAAMASPRASAGGGGIVINAPITVNATGGSDEIRKIVVEAFRQHRRELMDALESERARRARTRFE